MINARINRLRKLLKEYRIDAYILPGTDPHQNEYIPEIWQRRKWITGFTGSYGNFAITHKASGLWTDSRYFIQAESELKETEITLFKLNTPNTPDIQEWTINSLKPGSTVGLDPCLVSYRESEKIIERFTNKDIKIKWIENNLIDILWDTKTVSSDTAISIHHEKYSGKTINDKLNELKGKLKNIKADLHIISTLDSIAWLFNLRGNDIKYNPIFLSYAVITKSKAKIFIRNTIISNEVKTYLKDYADIYPYDDFKKHLSRYSNMNILIDPIHTNKWITDIISGKSNNLIFENSPLVILKSKKNPTEISGFKNAHIRDGIALCKFFYWLKNEITKNQITEISASDKLEYFRSNQELYRGPSFHTISAYAEHGAIVHYSATEKTNSTLTQNGLFLIDSGAQYLDGTTDITRTISLGNPTKKEIFYFTNVLKCHINLADAVFPEGTKGSQIDALARIYLWKIGEDFGHGTGHGIGSYLNVHEGPCRISSQCSDNEVPLEENMFLSIEPGFYKQGHFGIRIENLVIVTKDKKISSDNKSFYFFEPVTLCPFDINLIDKNLLSEKEINYLNNYHNKVYHSLKDYLTEEEREWLYNETLAI